MSRQAIGKGDRITFILNQAIPNENFILDELNKSFNRSDYIKQILYNYFISNQLSNNDNKVAINYTMNGNSMINKCTLNSNLITKELPKNDNKIINETNADKEVKDTGSFDINLDDIEDKEVNISNPIESNEASKNALSFMLNM